MSNGLHLDWNQNRIKAIVEHYGHPYFVHKKILDLGCGHGDLGGVLHRLGSDVVAVDARQEHLKIVDKKYAGVKIVKADLDGAWPFFGKSFDMILDLGLLCHLKNFEAHLKNVCASAPYLVLETAVADSNDPNYFVVKDDGKTLDGSFNGFSAQLSPIYIEGLLKKYGMSFKRVDHAKLNCGKFVYDWIPKNNNSYDIHKRRFWFCVNELSLQPTTTNIETTTLQAAALGSGIYSPHLVDSKVPLMHRPRVITSKSPSPPMDAAPVGAAIGIQTQRHVSHNRQPVSTANGIKIRLFFNYYEDANALRRKEIDLCLQKNLENPLLDLIIVQSEHSPTFDFLFDKINKLAGDNDISILCHSDIFFDDTIRLASHIQSKEIFALSAWEYVRDNHSNFSNDVNKQKVWIIRGKVQGVDGNFSMGKPGGAGHIAHQFQQAGYTVVNPSRSIKTYHVHSSGIRHYGEQDKVPGPYLPVDPTGLNL